MILCTYLYHFILKYIIYNFVDLCKLPDFLKFEWLLLKLLSSSLFRGYSLPKVLYHSGPRVKGYKYRSRTLGYYSPVTNFGSID